MANYRVKIVLQFETSVDVDDSKSKEEALQRARGFVRDAIAVEAYAVDHIKVTAKMKATRLPKEKNVGSKHGKTKKSKS
jgi:hypothetical protein